MYNVLLVVKDTKLREKLSDIFDSGQIGKFEVAADIADAAKQRDAYDVIICDPKLFPEDLKSGGTNMKALADTISDFFENRDERIFKYIDGIVNDIAEDSLRDIYKTVTDRIFSENEWLDLYQSNGDIDGSKNLFKSHISGLFRLYSELFPKVGNEKIRDVILYILNNPESDLKQKTVAAEFYINSSYLSTIFAAQTQQRFVDYLTAVKLTRAGWLLQNTPLTVTEIAARLDYKDIGYFSRLFKQHYGLTPTEYRIPDDYTYQI